MNTQTFVQKNKIKLAFLKKQEKETTRFIFFYLN